MAELKRFLVGYVKGAVLPRHLEQVVEDFLAQRDGVEEIRRLRGGVRVVNMTEEAAALLMMARPDLIVEEDAPLELYSPMPGLPPRFPDGPPTVLTFQLTDSYSGKPVPDVTVYCFGERLLYQGMSDKNGVAKVEVQEDVLSQVIASPKSGYWSKVVAPPPTAAGEPVLIELEPFFTEVPDSWSLQELGVDQVGDRFTGKGVKVAFIDSGVAPHHGLKVAGGYNALSEKDKEGWKTDEKGHGTHCSGVVAAREDGELAQRRGMAPGAEVYAVKVAPGGCASDLVEAINWCIDNYIDVIGINVGSKMPCHQVEQALLDAYQRGITCVAAAGNDAGAVSYPAALSHVIAVSAVGRMGTFPLESAHTLKASGYFGHDGDVFFANFSNYGDQIDVCAPGVAIPSTVPKGYAAWDGTSMACSHVTGMAALVLEAYPEVKTGDAYQPYYVRQVIADSAIDLGLPTQMQGAGMVNAALALNCAYARRLEEEQQSAAYRQCLQAMLDRARQAGAALRESMSQLASL